MRKLAMRSRKSLESVGKRSELVAVTATAKATVLHIRIPTFMASPLFFHWLWHGEYYVSNVDLISLDLNTFIAYFPVACSPKYSLFRPPLEINALQLLMKKEKKAKSFQRILSAFFIINYLFKESRLCFMHSF